MPGVAILPPACSWLIGLGHRTWQAVRRKQSASPSAATCENGGGGIEPENCAGHARTTARPPATGRGATALGPCASANTSELRTAQSQRPAVNSGAQLDGPCAMHGSRNPAGMLTGLSLLVGSRRNEDVRSCHAATSALVGTLARMSSSTASASIPSAWASKLSRTLWRSAGRNTPWMSSKLTLYRPSSRA